MDELAAADLGPHILEWSAELARCFNGRPDVETPIETQLVNHLPTLPANVRSEIAARFEKLLGGRVEWRRAPPPYPEWKADIEAIRARKRKENPRLTLADPHTDRLEVWSAFSSPRETYWLRGPFGQRRQPDRIEQERAGSGFMVIEDGLTYVNEVWAARRAGEKLLKHPFLPIMDHWVLTQPIRIPAEKRGAERSHGIMPLGLFPEAPRVGRIDPPAAFKNIDVRDRSEDSYLMLAPGAVNDDNLPLLKDVPGGYSTAPMLRLMDLAGVKGARIGRGARIDKAMFYFALSTTPREYRQPGVPYRHRQPWAWWRPKFYGDRFRPSEAESHIRAGFMGLAVAGVTMSDGGLWMPVVGRRMPNVRDPDSEMILEIEFPPDCDHGALVNLAWLAEARPVSDPAFDLAIGIAYVWDQAKAANGGYRIYATRPKARRNAEKHLLDAGENVILGRSGAPFKNRNNGAFVWPDGDAPVTDWRHPRAVIEGEERHPHAGKVPALSRSERHRLVYTAARTVSATQARNERMAADWAIVRAVLAGRCVIEVDGEALPASMLRVWDRMWIAKKGRGGKPTPPVWAPSTKNAPAERIAASDLRDAEAAWRMVRSRPWRLLEPWPRTDAGEA